MSSRMKLYSVLTRREDLTKQQVRDHWRHPHGTLARRIPTIVKYVQSHQIDTDLLGGDQDSYVGVAEVWVENLADALGYATEPTRAEETEPDEAEFVDISKANFFWTREEILESGQARRLDEARHDAYWEEEHPPLTIKVIQLVQEDGTENWDGEGDLELGRRIGAFRHGRSYPAPEFHGDETPFLGVRELWWPTLTRFFEGVHSDPEAWDELIHRPKQAITMLAQAERVK